MLTCHSSFWHWMHDGLEEYPLIVFFIELNQTAVIALELTLRLEGLYRCGKPLSNPQPPVPAGKRTIAAGHATDEDIGHSYPVVCCYAQHIRQPYCSRSQSKAIPSQCTASLTKHLRDSIYISARWSCSCITKKRKAEVDEL